MGLDVDEIGQVQRDLQFLRSWRQSTETVKRQSLITATIIVITAIIGLIGYKLFGQGP